MKKDVYVYSHAGALYINLTNHCTNACVFCLRTSTDGIEGNNLWLEKEPSAKDVIEDLGDMQDYDEVVFCGFGEPMIKIEELKEIAAYCREKGKKTRINTNGQANAYHNRDVVPEIAGLIDTVSISLNAGSAAHYQEICQSIYGREAYGHVLDFAAKCVAAGIHTVLSVVDVLDKEEIEEARRIAAGIGAILRVRHKI